jgi:hypothetical protein
MSGVLFNPPRFIPVNSSGRPYAGAKLYVYRAGTTTLATAYTTAALTVSHSNPQVANSAGQFTAMYLDPAAGHDYRFVLQTSAGAQLWVEDHVPASSMSAEAVGVALYPRTSAEISAGVTPSSYAVPSHDAAGVIYVERYGFNKIDSSSNQTTPLQSAYDVAVQCGGGIIEIPDSDFLATITVRHQGIIFRGQGGISSATIWRNVGSSAPYTINNTDRGLNGSGLERISLVNQDETVYTSTDGLVLTSESTGLNQMDYLRFHDVYVRNFRDNISITGRCIWTNFEEVRCEGALRDGFHLEASDNFSQNNFRLCRFGNSGRHGFYANLTFAGLLATGNVWDTCTFEQNEQNGIRITGTYGLANWTFRNTYAEENSGAIAASATSPRKVNIHVDSVYCIGLEIDGTFYGNTAPDVDIDHNIYVDTTSMTSVSGVIDNCRFNDAVVADVYWPKNVYLGMNTYSAVPVYTPALGSISLSDQNTISTFSPGISFGGASTGLTYTTQVGRYTVHGRLVTATAYVVINDNGSSTGAAKLTGLPIAATNVTNLLVTAAVAGASIDAGATGQLVAQVVPNTTTVALYRYEAGVQTALDESDLVNGSAISLTLSYFV